jgi:hypothetical protein
MNLLHRKYGCWIVGGIAFDHKLEALRHASNTNNSNIEFYYHNHVFDSVNRGLLGKVPLTTLYKERAEQLRDNYDYLVLHYSGGSDSHNVLHTFLSNNIKLDEVSVRWAKPLRDGKFYTANTTDTSARNGVSEWDYAIKPELEKLAISHPEIKINVVDFTDNLNSNLVSLDNIEKRSLELNFYRGSLGTLTQRLDPNIEDRVTTHSQGKVAHIYGIEKPYITIHADNISMCFQDSQLDPGIMPRNYQEGSVEYFYWTPDMPLLAIEQAYQVAQYLKFNLQARDFFSYEHLPLHDPARRIRVNAMNNLVKQILYGHSWDFDKFQAGKPSGSRNDWWFWLHETPELNTLHKNFIQAMKNITEGIDSRLVLVSQDTHGFVITRTKFYPLISL